MEPAISRYELDAYVQAHPAEDAVNVNCVASWCACADAEDRVERLLVNLHNGGQFDSRCWNGRTDAAGLFLSARQENSRGRRA